MAESTITFSHDAKVSNEELNALFEEAWPKHIFRDFHPVLKKSLTYITARSKGKLIGFVNVAWDGGAHGFVLDTTVHPDFQRKGLGLTLLNEAIDIGKKKGLEWLHVDYIPVLGSFYQVAGFKETKAGIIRLK